MPKKNIREGNHRRQRRTQNQAGHHLAPSDDNESIPGTGRASRRYGFGGGVFTIGQAARIIETKRMQP